MTVAVPSGSIWMQQTAEPIVIVAPHPDDEVIGCGGLIAARARNNLPVLVLYLTCATHARRIEAQDALRELGPVTTVEFGLDEGTVVADSENVQRLSDFLDDRKPSAVFMPGTRDRHPDHQSSHVLLARALIQLGLRAARIPRRIYCYEGFSPLEEVNSLLDISMEAELKWKALGKFTSQEALYRIVEVCRSLNRYRALTTFRRAVRFVEAFHSFEPSRYVSSREVAIS